jgi:hypothetical protein
MTKSAVKLIVLTALVVGGAVGVWSYYTAISGAYRIAKLEEEKRILQDVIGRLTAERRVAEMLVIEQKAVGGVKTSTVLFVEYDRTGKALPARTLTVRGENAHVDAMVIKFDAELVGKGDELRGKSIALFTRIYGDATAPEQGEVLDAPGQIPAAYARAGQVVTEFEMSLWRDFWTLAHDEQARAKRGVRALVGQGVWEPVRTDVLYTLTLESNGGLSLNREPLKPIYRQALLMGTTQPSPSGGGRR